jgi:hypothetical protein
MTERHDLTYLDRLRDDDPMGREAHSCRRIALLVREACFQ